MYIKKNRRPEEAYIFFCGDDNTLTIPPSVLTKRKGKTMREEKGGGEERGDVNLSYLAVYVCVRW